MYPLTHLYMNHSILGEMTPGEILGSVLPDLLVACGLAWDRAHNLKNGINIPFRVFLADAMHGIELPGLDYYTDRNYKNGVGYAFYKSRYIKDSLIALGVPPIDAIWRGHNVIEMAIELDIKKKYMSEETPLKKAQQEVDMVSNYSRAFSLAENRSIDLKKPLDKFTEMNGDPKQLAQHFAWKINTAYGLQIKAEEILFLVDQARPHIDKDYPVFLAQVQKAMTLSIQPYLEKERRTHDCLIKRD